MARNIDLWRNAVKAASLVLFSLFWCADQAFAEVISLPEDTVVYGRPDLEANISYRLSRGTRIAVSKPSGGFQFVKFKRQGKVRSGYIHALHREATDTNKPRFAFGLGLLNSSLSQSGKNFTTTDQVNYTTSKYSSSDTYPELIVQYGLPISYWRLKLGQRTSTFKSTAQTNLMGTSPQPLTVDYVFLSGVLQKTWPLLATQYFYWGLGGELAQASSVKASIGGTILQTSASDKPTFFGAEGLVGATVSFWNTLSGFVEAEYIVIPNQSPLIMGLQLNLGITY